MLPFLLGIAGLQVKATVQRAAINAVLLAFAALFLMGTMCALLFALFVFLADMYGIIPAALILAGASFVVALLLYLVVVLRRRRPKPIATGMMSAAPTMMAASMARPKARSGPLLSGKTVLSMAAGAAVIGLILGRRL